MKKVIVISGCSSGLGKYIAEKLESKGNKIFAGIRDEEAIKELSKIWKKEGKDITPIKLDVTNDEVCQKAVKKILQHGKRIDVVINNAASVLVGPASEQTSQNFLDILNTNTVGAFRLTKYVLPSMKEQKGGKIINITSLNGILALPNFAMYCSSKFALEALGLAWRYEVARDNIWITSLAPGAIMNPDEHKKKKMPHKPAREKFFILKLLMPFLTYEKITNKIESIINQSNPPAEVIMGADAFITSNLQRFLPRNIWDRLVLYVWNK
ncbi:MAG: SDR family NAD(P)-dependent oxidoreductase [Patescibacteria group bacterium]